MRFETRAQLGLREPSSRPRIPGPVESLTVHYNGPAVKIPASSPHSRCQAFWRGIQIFHMTDPSRRWADIAYTFGICQHGIIMAGRGAGVRTAANGTNQGNNVSYAVMVLVGGNERATLAALAAIREAALGLGVRRLRHHSYWKSTDCAGSFLNSWVGDNSTVQVVTPTPVQPTPPTPNTGDDDMPSASEVADEVLKRLTRSTSWRGDDANTEVDMLRRTTRETMRLALANYRATLGLPDSPDDDQKWVERVERGERTMTDAITALRNRAK